MRILVTGGAGFIGSHTAEMLRNVGNEVFILDNFSTGKIENIFCGDEKSFRDRKLTVEECDINDLAGVSDIFHTFEPEAVIHLAAQSAISTAINDPAKDCMVNAVGTLNMLKASMQYGVKRFVFSSTSAVYGEYKKPVLFERGISESHPTAPSNPYGISKWMAESYIRLLFPNHVILRYGNVFGPRQVPIGENQVIPRMIKHFLYGDKFYIHGSGNQSRDFVYVDDVVRANLYALLAGSPGTYNIGSGKPVSINYIAQIIETIFAVPGYKWDHTPDEDPRYYIKLDNSAAVNSLSWLPKTSLAEGISRTVEWWQGKNDKSLHQS